MEHFRVKSVFTLFLIQCLYVQCSANACETTDNESFVCRNYIPTNVRVGIKNVVLKDFQGNLIINKTTFLGQGWNKIRSLTLIDQSDTFYVTITADGFTNLYNLTELHLHILRTDFAYGFLVPLQKITLLDLTSCRRLGNFDFVKMVMLNTSLPALNKLILVNAFNQFGDGIHLTDDLLYEIFIQRPVAYVDFSNSVIGFSNFTALNMYCNKIEYLLLRGTYILRDDEDDNYRPQICKSLKVVDFSQIVSSKTIYCLMPNISGLHDYPIPTNQTYSYGKTVFYTRKLYANNLCKAYSPLPKVFKNSSMIWKNIFPEWKIEEMYFEENLLQYLDINVACAFESINPSVRLVSLRGNGLQFIHPSVLHCFFGYVEVLDLSDNFLGQMYNQNAGLFDAVFSLLYLLRSINLTNNQIGGDSRLDFSNNSVLERLTLSYNGLRHVHIKFSQTNNIDFLDLSFNRLEVLDNHSQDNLNKLVVHSSTPSSIRNLSMFLEGNPFACYECSHLESVNWLYTHSKYIKDFQRLTCSNSHRKPVAINQAIIDDLSSFCAIPRIIAAVSISVSTIFTFLLSVVAFKKIKKRKLKIRNRRQFLEDLREVPDDTDFLVFLSYCSKDDDFVNGQLRNSLDESLKQAVGVVRTLVCTGDSHFRLGRTIPDEMVHWISNSFAVVIVLTDSYLQSEFCQMEFQQAHLLRKPIIFMLKDKVTVDLMPSAMVELYHTYVRIHWITVNGRAELKTSWDKVSDSIIDLAVEGNKRQKDKN